MIDEIGRKTTEDPSLTSFLAVVQPRLERALIARFGITDGLDAASEATAYAAENWHRLRLMDNPAGYLYRVGQSKGRRLAHRWQRLDALVTEPKTSDRVLDLDLQRALMKLKADQRVAIVLVHAHGHTYAEAAEILNLPVTTITNHLNRGLTRLRQALEL